MRRAFFYCLQLHLTVNCCFGRNAPMKPAVLGLRPIASGFKPECLPMTAWNRSRTERWLDEHGFGLELDHGLRAQALNGELLASVTPYELRQWNMTAGRSAELVDLVHDTRIVVDMNKPPTRDPCSFMFNGTMDIIVDVYLLRLVHVDDVNYKFEMTFWYDTHWFDDRWQYLPQLSTDEMRKCKSPVLGNTNLCADDMWSPEANGYVYQEALLEQSQISPRRKECFGNGAFEVPPHVMTSNVLVKSVASARFAFDDFPFDVQDLSVVILYGGPYMSQTVNITMGAIRRRATDPRFDDASGWCIASLAAGGTSIAQSFHIYPSDHPFAIMNQHTANNAGLPAVILRAQVKRLSRYYLLNLVVPIVMLTVLSWTSFLLPPTAIESRLATALTVLLSFVALTITINEQLPATARMTRLHKFILAANVLIVGSALESILIYWLRGSRWWAPPLKKLDQTGTQNVTVNENDGGSRTVAPVSATDVESELQSVYAVAQDSGDVSAAAQQAVPPLQPNERADSESDAEHTTTKSLCDLCREGVHWLDQFCLVVFPVAFAAVCSTLLNDPHKATECSDVAEIVPWGTMSP